jgi:hypothetical protein
MEEADRKQNQACSPAGRIGRNVSACRRIGVNQEFQQGEKLGDPPLAESRGLRKDRYY